MNTAVCEFILNHALLILICYVTFHVIISTAVHSLPIPREDSSQGYIFVFTFMNAIVRNIASLRALSRLVELDTPKKFEANTIEVKNKEIV